MEVQANVLKYMQMYGSYLSDYYQILYPEYSKISIQVQYAKHSHWRIQYQNIIPEESS